LRIALAVVAAAWTAGAAGLPQADLEQWIKSKDGFAVRDTAGNIVEVSLARSWATDNDVDRVLVLKGLKRLDLSYTYVTDRGIERLGALTQLEDLNLDTAEYISDVTCSYLRANRQLRRLSLRGTDITDISLQYLSSLTGLKSLDISQTQVSDVGLEHLASFPGLEELNLGGTKTSGVNLNVLKLLPKLRKLGFSGIQRRNAGACWAPGIAENELETISLLAGLEDLDLGLGVGLGAPGRSNSTRGGEAECRVIGGIRVTNLGLAKLAKLKRLQKLDISGAEVNAEGLAALEKLPQLARLSLWNCKAVDDSAAPVLARMPALTDLDLSYTAMSDAGLRQLAVLPHLKRLYLMETKTVQASVAALEKERAGLHVYWGHRPPPIPPAALDSSVSRRLEN
jgi:Leucine-rich repeat (LRR) protein